MGMQPRYSVVLEVRRSNCDIEQPVLSSYIRRGWIPQPPRSPSALYGYRKVRYPIPTLRLSPGGVGGFPPLPIRIQGSVLA
jgi:hypothetical protein